MTYEPTPAPLPTTSWNKLAIWAFVTPFITFALVRTIGHLLLGDNVNATYSSQVDPAAAVTSAILSVIVDVLGYATAVTLGHLSLRAKYRQLRGRGLGIAGLVLGYLGVALTLFALAALLVLPILAGAASQS